MNKPCFCEGKFDWRVQAMDMKICPVCSGTLDMEGKGKMSKEEMDRIAEEELERLTRIDYERQRELEKLIPLPQKILEGMTSSLIIMEHPDGTPLPTQEQIVNACGKLRDLIQPTYPTTPWEFYLVVNRLLCRLTHEG